MKTKYVTSVFLASDGHEPAWDHVCRDCRFIGSVTANGKNFDLFNHQPDIVVHYGSDLFDVTIPTSDQIIPGVDEEVRYEIILIGKAIINGEPIKIEVTKTVTIGSTYQYEDEYYIHQDNYESVLLNRIVCLVRDNKIRAIKTLRANTMGKKSTYRVGDVNVEVPEPYYWGLRELKELIDLIDDGLSYRHLDREKIKKFKELKKAVQNTESAIEHMRQAGVNQEIVENLERVVEKTKRRLHELIMEIEL